MADNSHREGHGGREGMTKGKWTLLLGVLATIGAIGIAQWRRRRGPEQPGRPAVEEVELNGAD